jgi:hypothetical protein
MSAPSALPFKGLFFGPPGHGKTRLIATAALDERTRPFLFLDFEGGTQSIKGLPGEGTDWEMRTVRSWQDYNEAYEELRSGTFKGTGVDSLSETHMGALLTILDENRGQRRDDDKLEIQDYGKAMIQVRKFARAFRDLPIHVFFTAHSKTETDPREGLITVPSLSGKLAHEIPGMMDVSAYLALATNEEGKTYRSLLLQNYAKIRTKVRAPWGIEPPDEINNPTVTSILDALGYE